MRDDHSEVESAGGDGRVAQFARRGVHGVSLDYRSQYRRGSIVDAYMCMHRVRGGVRIRPLTRHVCLSAEGCGTEGK